MIYNVFIGTGVVAILAVLLAERQYQRKKKVQLYCITDTVTNTACGISDRVFNIFFDTIQFVIWSQLYTYVALIQFPSNVFIWFLCLFVVDFIWYWYHRLGHEVRLFWAVHSLHHQSEEFNISVGFRISIFQSILRGVFWLLLPILGFHPELILTVLVFHGLYQLPLHTKVMKHIPWLEYIFVTPSAHRVHHGINEQYLDKNYGGVFMFWDRMFGTYEPEKEEVNYGITDRAGNLGFLQAHIYGFRQLFLPGNLKLTASEKRKYLLSKPSYVPENLKGKNIPKVVQFEVKSELSKYVLAQIVMSTIITVFFIFNRSDWNMNIKAAMVFFIFWTLASATLRFNQISKLLIFHESIRNACIAMLAVYLYWSNLVLWYFALPVLLSVIISFALLPFKNKNLAT